MDDQLVFEKLASRCRPLLARYNTPTEEEYNGYWCLPQIVLDAVFSINARYESATNVVERYQAKTGLQVGREQSVSEFLAFSAQYSYEDFARIVLENSQRTSPQGGILKAEAAVRFAKVLKVFGVDCLADRCGILDSDRFCRHIRAIPGQQISCDYFLMLLGRKDLVKPDRRLLAFLSDCLDGAPVDGNRAYVLLNGATDLLAKEHCGLQPRFLDHMIWKFMDKPRS